VKVESAPAAPPPRTDGEAPERFRKAAEAFEAMLVQSLLRSMREAQLEEGFFGQGTGASTYEAMFESHLAESIATGSPLGIARALETQWGDRVEDEANAQAKIDDALLAYDTHGVSSPFGWRKDPLDGTERFHDGVDLPAREGTPVIAVAPGRVLEVGRNGGYGLEVVVEHGEGWRTRYAHLSATHVRPGDRIARGARLGDVGGTGRSTGPHLHFEALREGKSVDPALAAPGPLRPQVLRENADE
jgi:murein DD-endopeptidase MepM/ murein hydrolase activator NlpD